MNIIRFGVHVTGRTGELGIVGWVSMAFRTRGPFTHMFARIDRKISSIVFQEFCWHPARISGMAGSTIGREATLDVIGVLGRLKIGLVTGETIGRSILVGAIVVALGTIGNGVTQGQRKKTVVYLICIPVDLIDVVALCTVGGEVVFDMVWTGSRLKILQVAIHAVISDAVESQAGI